MPPLEICQFEFRCRDLSLAATFVEEAFGWRLTPAGVGYVLANPGRPPVIGLMQTAHAEVPTGVTPYVRVADAGEAFKTALALGGRGLIGRTPAGAAGYWAHVLDPWGNELAFWEAARAVTPPHVDPVHNPLVWYEIPVADLAAAARFYRQLCGWTFQVAPGVEAFAYFRDTRQAVGVGLVGGPRGERLRELTPYAATPDLEAAVAMACAAGAAIRTGPEGGPEGGRFAVLTTPDGNPIGLFEAPAEAAQRLARRSPEATTRSGA